MKLDNINRLYYFTSYIFLCGHVFICMLPGSLDASPRNAVRQRHTRQSTNSTWSCV